MRYFFAVKWFLFQFQAKEKKGKWWKLKDRGLEKGNRSQWQRMSDDANNIFNSCSQRFISFWFYYLDWPRTLSFHIFLFFICTHPISLAHDSCSFYFSVLHIFHVTKKVFPPFPSHQNAIAWLVCFWITLYPIFCIFYFQ